MTILYFLIGLSSLYLLFRSKEPVFDEFKILDLYWIFLLIVIWPLILFAFLVDVLLDLPVSKLNIVLWRRKK